MKKQDIIDIVNKLYDSGLLTRAPSNEEAFKRFKDSNDVNAVIKFILSNGEPSDTNQCSECKEILSADQFTYYQARVSKSGYLSRTNALCHQCAKRLDKQRQKVFKVTKRIPPKPKSGTRCPNCNRAWSGNWHRHHSHETDEFLDWLCGNCNMALQDRRTPTKKF